MTTWAFEFTAVSKAAAREHVDTVDAPDVVKAMVKAAIGQCTEPGRGRLLLVACDGHWPSDHEYSGRSGFKLETRFLRAVT